MLNPALGDLNDGGYAFSQWQQRMLSYRRGQYERRVQRNLTATLAAPIHMDKTPTTTADATPATAPKATALMATRTRPRALSGATMRRTTNNLGLVHHSG